MNAAIYVSAKLSRPIPPDVIELIREWWVSEFTKMMTKCGEQGAELENPRVWQELQNEIRDKYHIYCILRFDRG